LTICLALVALAAVCVVILVGPRTAEALEGAEPLSSTDFFQLVLEETTRPMTVYERLSFWTSADEWDFEDRDGYECANVAIYGPSNELLVLADIEQNRDYITGTGGGTFRINDRYGAEAGEGQNRNAPYRQCGNETGGPPADSRWVPSGEDHFPHFHEGADPATHGVQFFGTPEIAPILERAEAALNRELTNESCDRFYWTPGDEPKELVGWWDVDGPENGHHDGSDPLDCGGGDGEPIAAVRMYFAFLAPNVGVCILDHEIAGGRLCSGAVAPSPSPTVTPSPTPSPAPSPTASPTSSPTPCTGKGCASQTPSPSVSPSPGPSPSPSPSPSPTSSPHVVQLPSGTTRVVCPGGGEPIRVLFNPFRIVCP
jgi:hypothetical protein